MAKPKEQAAQEPPKQEQTAPAAPAAQETGIVARKAPPREPIPAGNYFARCYMMIYLGTVEETFNGNTKKAQKVRIGWELPTELRVFRDGEEEKPCAISAEYTLSTSPKANLRHIIDSWRGKALTEQQAEAFDITALLGKACMLNIIHNPGKGKNLGKIYEKIVGVSPLPKDSKGKVLMSYEPVSEVKYFNYGDKFDVKFVEALPDFIKNKIKSSDEWKMIIEKNPGIIAQNITPAEGQQPTMPEIADEDLPF